MLNKEICLRCYFDHAGVTKNGLDFFIRVWQERSCCSCFLVRKIYSSRGYRIFFADDLPIYVNPPEACPYMLEQLLSDNFSRKL